MWENITVPRTIGISAAVIICLYTARLLLRSRKNKRKIKRIIDTLSRNKFSKSPAIGIDLGTSLSRVAVFQDDNVFVLADKQGVQVLPSFVSYTDTEVLVGEAARALVIANAANTIYDIKLLLGRDSNDPWIEHCKTLLPFILIDSNNELRIEIEQEKKISYFTPEQIASILFAKLKENAEYKLGRTISDAVVVIPPFFNDAQKRALLNAGTLAGLNVIQIINESSAAAIAYKFKNPEALEKDNQILVFHLGAGSCSVSIIAIKENAFIVKATTGTCKVSGREFDNKMVEFFVSEFQNRFNQNISSNKIALQRLRFACERAKRILSASIIANIEINSILPDTDFYFSLTRNEFEHITSDLYDEITQVIDRVLNEACLPKFAIDHVIYTGGAIKIPKVQHVLSNYFVNKPFETNINADEIAVWGAALQAAVITGDYVDSIPFLHLLDAIPLSLGIETVGGLMTVMIPRNTPLPAKKSLILTTYHDNQYSILVQVYEGERMIARDNTLLGKLKLSDIPPKIRGAPQILVTFEIDVNGILSVSASEITSGKHEKITIIRNNNLLSRSHIDEAVKDAERCKEQDEERCESIAAKMALENYLWQVRETLESCDFNNYCKLHELEKAKLLEQCTDTLHWLGSNSCAPKEELDTKLTLLKGTFTPIVRSLYNKSQESIHVCNSRCLEDKLYSSSSLIINRNSTDQFGFCN